MFIKGKQTVLKSAHTYLYKVSSGSSIRSPSYDTHKKVKLDMCPKDTDAPALNDGTLIKVRLCPIITGPYKQT